MQKLMIVSDDIVGQALKLVLADRFEEIILTDRKKALEVFLLEDPTHVLISDMTGSKEEAETVKDIRSANMKSRIVRYGFDDEMDIQLPELIPAIIEKILGQGEDDETGRKRN